MNQNLLQMNGDSLYRFANDFAILISAKTTKSDGKIDSIG